MIKRKEKKCKECGNMRYLFGHGLCQGCYNIKYSAPIQSNPSKKHSPISKISILARERLKKYKLLRSEYLTEHIMCECCELTAATEIHHKAGRDGQNLFQHFLAVCSSCHHRIEMNPIWAKENNYSISRLN